MNTKTQMNIDANLKNMELEFATFYVEELLLGINIQQVQEINKQLEITPVPHVPAQVHGVINLRGEVVTILDLRKILSLDPTEITELTRLVVITDNEENIGLLVDRIADVVIADGKQIEPPPANVSGIDGRFFQGVYKLKQELLVILNVEEIISEIQREVTANA